MKDEFLNEAKRFHVTFKIDVFNICFLEKFCCGNIYLFCLLFCGCGLMYISSICFVFTRKPIHMLAKIS